MSLTIAKSKSPGSPKIPHIVALAMFIPIEKALNEKT